jgi:hypothetical protein
VVSNAGSAWCEELQYVLNHHVASFLDGEVCGAVKGDQLEILLPP